MLLDLKLGRGLLYLRIQLVLAVAMHLQCEDAPRSEGSPWFAKYNSNVSIIGYVPEEISQVYILVNKVISLSWFCFFLDAQNCQVLSPIAIPCSYLLTNLLIASSAFYWPAFMQPPQSCRGQRSHAY